MTRSNTSRSSATPPAAPEGGEPDGSSLESFVAQLQTEGVEAGRKEAEHLIAAAQAEAAEIVRRARSEAEGIVGVAQDRAVEAEARGRVALELAIRDALLQLQAALTEVLSVALAHGVRASLSDTGLLEKLLEHVVSSYASANAAGRVKELRVPRQLNAPFTAWWQNQLATALSGNHGAPALTAVLEDAGFEYRLSEGGTVEVSVESTVEKLMELVRPGLRELVAAAGAELSSSRPLSTADDLVPVASARGG